MLLQMAKPSPLYIPGLDGIRAIAFLMVLLSHSGLGRSYTGGTGVSIFFFLSGFLITTLLRREWDKTGSISLLDFYIRRAFRILPPLYITIAFGILASRAGLIGGHAGLFSTACAAMFGGNYYMLSPTHNWPDGFSVVWSLAIEEHFYLLFPLLYLAIVSWSRRKQVILLAGLCAIALAWRIFLVFLMHGERRIYLCTDTRFDSILFGCILAIGFNPTMDKLPRLLKNPYFASAGLLGVLGWEHIPFAKGTIAYTLTAASLIPVLSYVITNANAASVRWLDSRILRQIGTWSYSLYLCHLMFISAFVRHSHMKLLVCALLSLPIAVAFAICMDRFVDRRSRELRARVLSQLHPPQPIIGPALP
jgi:peptidoglycan/LPS O-acetylase OafA/YrhL